MRSVGFRKYAAGLLLALLTGFLAAPYMHRVHVCADGAHHEASTCTVCQLALHTPLDLAGPLVVAQPVCHELPALRLPAAPARVACIWSRAHTARGPPAG